MCVTQTMSHPNLLLKLKLKDFGLKRLQNINGGSNVVSGNDKQG